MHLLVKCFANTAKPMNRLTGKENALEWTEECWTAFEELKKKLCSSPVMAYPDPTKEFSLDIDYSNWAMSAILSQTFESGKRISAYVSKILKAEQNYCVIRKELLAVVKAMKIFHK